MSLQGRLILEIHSSHTGPTITHHQRIDGFPFSIGRAFDNDVILHDPFVSPHHLEIGLHEEEGWVVRDLDSDNGFALNHKDKTGKEERLHSGDEVRIGRTRILLYAEEHPVGQTIRLVRDHPWLRFLASTGIGWLLFLTAVMAMMLRLYYTEWTDDVPNMLVTMAIVLMGLSLIWSSIWALVGRLIRHKSQFSGQLAVFSLVMLLSLVIEVVDGYTAYLTNEGTFSMILSEGMFFALGVFLIYGCLALSTEMQMRRRLTIAAVFSGGVIMGSFLFMLATAGDAELKPEYPYIIKPYLTEIAPSQSLDEYMAGSAAMFDTKAFEKPLVVEEAAATQAGAAPGDAADKSGE